MKRQILKFHKSLKKDSNHRYHSWEHCFFHFKKVYEKNIKVDYDLAALNLAFYLASWGMYRGKSFLLWKDYKIHKGAVRILFRKEFRELWDLKFDKELPDTLIDLILRLKNSLIEYYKEQSKVVNGLKRTVKTWDTLISKILLGTICCVPAFDRYFLEGMRKKKQTCINFKAEGIRNIFSFYIKNKNDFDEAYKSIKKISKLNYPPMKLVDMYFWQLGQE